MKTQVQRDMANYLELSEPFEDGEAANEALSKFYSALSDLRRKHRFPDVHVIIQVNVRHGGEVGRGLSSAHFGNSAEAPAMCAWSYGKEQAEHQKRLDKLLAASQTAV